MTDRAFLYTCNRHFPLKYLHQVGRSLASANLLVSPAYGQELYVGVDNGADSGSAVPRFGPFQGPRRGGVQGAAPLAHRFTSIQSLPRIDWSRFHSRLASSLRLHFRPRHDFSVLSDFSVFFLLRQLLLEWRPPPGLYNASRARRGERSPMISMFVIAVDGGEWTVEVATEMRAATAAVPSQTQQLAEVSGLRWVGETPTACRHQRTTHVP